MTILLQPNNKKVTRTLSEPYDSVRHLNNVDPSKHSKHAIKYDKVTKDFRLQVWEHA